MKWLHWRTWKSAAKFSIVLTPECKSEIYLEMTDLERVGTQTGLRLGKRQTALRRVLLLEAGVNRLVKNRSRRDWRRAEDREFRSLPITPSNEDVGRRIPYYFFEFYGYRFLIFRDFQRKIDLILSIQRVETSDATPSAAIDQFINRELT